MTDKANLPAIPQPSSSPCAASSRERRSDWLAPVGAKQGTAELMACLTLVSPGGMTAEERGQWVSVARQALSGIPADLLAKGASAARRKCRFPSEIVPTIMETIGETWRLRERLRSEAADRDASRDTLRLAKPDYVTPAEAKAILAQFGLRSHA